VGFPRKKLPPHRLSCRSGIGTVPALLLGIHRLEEDMVSRKQSKTSKRTALKNLGPKNGTKVNGGIIAVLKNSVQQDFH
jgi:hypothetical protein